MERKGKLKGKDLKMEPSQIESIKEKLKLFGEVLRKRAKESHVYGKENREKTERYYHQGKADATVGILVDYDSLFYEDLQ